MNRLPRLLPPVFLALVLAWVYGATLAPGLTWANGGADGGDLIAATATGGIPHPTGYPVYLLLAGFFHLLPVGLPAFRFTLLSALASIGAALLLYEWTRRLLPDADVWTSRLAGLASAFALGLSPLVWSQAVIAEVYGLHALFLASILFLSSDLAGQGSPKRLDIAIGLLFGLSLGNHLTSAFLLPIVFFPAIKDPRSLARRVACLALGLLPYAILPLRALSHPPVNWGNPVTWDNFIWLVSGRLYQDELFSVTAARAWESAQALARLLLEQFGVAGLGLGILGLAVSSSPARSRWNLLWTAVIFSTFFIVYATRDSQVYLIPVILSFSVWIGQALGRWMDKWPSGWVWLAAAFAACLLVSAAQTWPRVDASQDRRAEEFGRAVLADLPRDALVFAKGDEAVFALWYFHFALGERSDVSVIASELLHHAWYQDALRAAYPSLVVPGPFPFEESLRLSNPTRPACYVEYAGRAEVECLDPVR